MKSLSSVGLGLSLVFGCLLLALVAEIYYLFWWKRRIVNGGIEDGYSSPAKEFFHTFCWKKPSSLTSSSRRLNPQEICSSETLVLEPQSQHQISSNKDFWHYPFTEDGLDSELMNLQHLSGPPRFLFTITEETKEDLESEDGKSHRSRKGSRNRSLSDVIYSMETPYLTPLASPSYFTPPLTPIRFSQSQQGGNSFFEFASDAEFNRLRSSPPPTFQFLRDAEEKLCRRKVEEKAEVFAHQNDEFVQVGNEKNGKNIRIPSSSSMLPKNEENGSVITILVSKNREKEQDDQQNGIQSPSSSSNSTLSSNNKGLLHHQHNCQGS